MVDELKDQRVPTMMTPSGVKAIDDWMFEDHLRSRGDAIIQICRRGLEYEATHGLAMAASNTGEIMMRGKFEQAVLGKYTLKNNNYLNVIKVCTKISKRSFGVLRWYR